MNELNDFLDPEFEINRSNGFRCDPHTPRSENEQPKQWEGEFIYTQQYAPLEIVRLADIGYSGVKLDSVKHLKQRKRKSFDQAFKSDMYT